MISLLDHPLLSSRYFFPRRVPVQNPFSVTAADGASVLACYRATPHEDALTLLHFHGNAEVVADYVPGIAGLVTALGVNIVFAEYRGFGSSTGAASLGAMLDDSEVVFRALGLPPERVVPFGRSLGTLFAVEVASRHPQVAGLILESGIADPLEPGLVRVAPEDLGVTPRDLEAAVRARLDQHAKLASYRGPLLVLHAAADTLIPRTHAERNFASAGAPPQDKQLVVFERGDHGSIFPANRDDYLGHLATFLRRLEGPPELAPLGAGHPGRS